MAKHHNRTIRILRESENARLFALDNGGLRLVLSPPLPGLELPPGHARTEELLGLVGIADDEEFEEAAIASVGS